MIKGTFLYYPNAAYFEKTRDVLRRLDLDIREIEANAEIVFNLVPEPLRRSAESWLILHHWLEDQEHLLILPFPDENHLQLFSNTPEVFLRPIIMELSALIEMFVYNRDFNNDFPQWPRRFQYLCIDVPLDFLINPELRPPQEQQEIYQTFRLCEETRRDIQRRREGSLRRAQRENNFSVLGELDNVFSKAADKLFREIRNRGFREIVPLIVHDFWEVMDGETMRFLITSETVSEFANKYSPPNFDYSAPGCGLWKAVERELNLSLVLHLRRAADIVESVSIPWKRSGNISEKFPILTAVNQSADLTQLESKPPKNLKGIELGTMKRMLEWGHCNSIREKLESLFSSSDPILQCFLIHHAGLGKIIELRNGHAHINAMSRQKFGELRNLVLPSRRRDTSETALVKILQLKREILRYWEDNGDHFKKSPVSVNTENHGTIDLSLYNRVSVRPVKNGATELVAIGRYCSDRSIAMFEKIEEANAALASLVQAADAGKSWDVLEFKQDL